MISAAKPPKPRRKNKRKLADGRWRCTRCKIARPVADFAMRKDRDEVRPNSWCRTCVAVGVNEHRQTEAGRAKAAEYRRRPEVIERDRARDEGRRDYIRERNRAWRNSPRGKLVAQRSNVRWKLSRATDPRRVATLRRRLAAIEAEIARIDRPRLEVRSVMAAERIFGGPS